MMKKFLSILAVTALALAMCLTFAACGNEETADPGSEPGNGDFKVGAIYINSQNDTAGYTYQHHAGITAAMNELGLNPETDLIIVDEVTDSAAVSAACDTLVEAGCDIIFGISYNYIDAMEEAAAAYPAVIFSHATGNRANETNFNNYSGRIYQAHYLSGITAGLKSLELGNNNIGFVSAYGTANAETCSSINAFTLGAQSVNPQVQVHVNIIGAWENEELERSLTQDLITTYGCCVIAQDCDSAQPQLTAAENGVFGCGYNSDMTSAAPQAHLTAPIWNWGVYYQLAIESAMTDPANFIADVGNYYGGLADGFVGISPLSDNCVAATQGYIDAVSSLLISGEWDVFSGVKLTYNIAEDGTVTVNQNDAALIDAAGNPIIAAGGAPIADEAIAASMNYFVQGVIPHNN